MWKKFRSWPKAGQIGVWVALGLVALVGIGAVVGTEETTVPAPVTSTPQVDGSVDDSSDAPPAPEPTAPAGDTLPGDGTFVVGAEMKPGLWKGNDASGGYWATLKNVSGELDAIVANDNVASGNAYVQVGGAARYFEANGFTEWVKVPAKPTGPKATSFPGEGMYMVGVDIAPGTYRAKSDGSGYWARLSNASGELGGIIANDNVLSSTTTIVEIRSGDAFFKTSGFDQWTKAG